MHRLLLLIGALLFSAWTLAAVNVNTATKEELEALPGVGPVKAQAIIDHRKQNGPFKNVNDLKNVKGIGDATFDQLKGQVTITGSTTQSSKAATTKTDTTKTDTKKDAMMPTKAESKDKAAPAVAAKKDEKPAAAGEKKTDKSEKKADEKKADEKKADEKKADKPAKEEKKDEKTKK